MEEIAARLGLSDLKQTRVYQEASNRQSRRASRLAVRQNPYLSAPPVKAAVWATAPGVLQPIEGLELAALAARGRHCWILSRRTPCRLGWSCPCKEDVVVAEANWAIAPRELHFYRSVLTYWQLFRPSSTVYVKQIELSRFKSFGATTTIPLLPGFTVISGPNGSGKSNILDALLFALGLSGSKGMRAERLPDLVNQAHSRKGRTVEAYVAVTFQLENPEEAAEIDPKFLVSNSENGTEHRDGAAFPSPLYVKEWQITRKLRVTGHGTYTSTYYINGIPCTLGELHEQLSRLRIYPEGYNVVLQGDVTGIISMNARDRREIIDELAGVGEFDRKIGQAKDKLDDVKLQEDRFRIVEQELMAAREKLKDDRVKAEKYQTLRLELERMQAAEIVLQHRQLRYQQSVKEIELANARASATDLKEKLAAVAHQIAAETERLESLNARVHSLGEEEYLALSTELASKQAELRAVQRHAQEIADTYSANQERIIATQEEIDTQQRESDRLLAAKGHLTADLDTLTAARDREQELANRHRRDLQEIAAAAEDWMRQQTQLRQDIDALQAKLDPVRQEWVRLTESRRQWAMQLEIQERDLASLGDGPGRSVQDELALYQGEMNGAQALVQSTALQLSETQHELQTCRETLDRLTQEQRAKHRQLDKLEAQAQATQEVQGTKASQVILEAGIAGVCGLVAQLGAVDPKFQLALETAAGGRLGHIVVESDEVAAEAIALLKIERAGRATFLPMNKLKPAQTPPPLEASWKAIDYALNLIDYDNRYRDVFAYVFGSTVVFERLEGARPHLGKARMVTLEGDLLEITGAMTGGSVARQMGSLRFGTAQPSESEEAQQLRDRLLEIDRMIARLHQKTRALQGSVEKYEAQLQHARTAHQQAQLQYERLRDRTERITQDRDRLQAQIQQNRTAIEVAQAQIAHLETQITELEQQIQAKRAEFAAIEQSSAHNRWQEAQAVLQVQEQQLNAAELALRAAVQQLADTDTALQLASEKIGQRQARLQELRAAQTDLLNTSTQLQTQAKALETAIAQVQLRLDALEGTISAAKQERDACDRALRGHQTQQQQWEWQLQKQEERRTELTELLDRLREQLAAIELPDPAPEVPEGTTLEQLQLEQRRLQKRLQSLEPVNMMAIAEYEAVSTRLEELSARLETLNQERTELLLRIENFTTLRQRAFMQAFDAVNQNFKAIFAELSDGDGYLQLENPSAPLSGGLTLVAHPKGKPVQHLASMSGGEKSLTALSFIFALQRYRPSPFYAFDEVDMFLDGANVERLSRMVRKQASLAQFIVVSLRRPMIEAAERTIGVTQARGAHTQVLGLELRSG